MSEITLTEALAELKLIKARVEKKKEFVSKFLCRQEGVKDPLEKQGGSVAAIKAERQSMNDLLVRFLLLRTKIAEANSTTQLTIDGVTRSIAEWLIWRRDVAPMITGFQTFLAKGIEQVRRDARSKGVNVVSIEAANSASDVIVNIDEKELSEWIEKTTETLGVLDGKLSLHNATVKVAV